MMTQPWIEFCPPMVIREAIALRPTNEERRSPERQDVDHIGTGSMIAGQIDDNPPSVLVAIRYRAGTTYCAATQPDIARQIAADLIAAADLAEGKDCG